MPEIVTHCPSCRSIVQAVRLHCSACDVAVEGRFDLCPFCRLGDEQRAFALTFLRCRGNIKEVERDMGISYPTVRGKLEELLRAFETPAAAPRTRLQLLQDLQNGRLSREEAMEQLRGLS